MVKASLSLHAEIFAFIFLCVVVAFKLNQKEEKIKKRKGRISTPDLATSGHRTVLAACLPLLLSVCRKPQSHPKTPSPQLNSQVRLEEPCASQRPRVVEHQEEDRPASSPLLRIYWVG